MKTSPKGISFIAAHEGEILKVYKDPIGLPTLGVGHLLTSTELEQMPVGTKITKEQSREYLAKDLARFERAITKAVQVPVTQNQFDALVSFSFNIGESAFKRSSCLRKLNQKDYAGAADAMLAWNKAGGKVLAGLTRRRKEERRMFLTPDSAAATLHPTDSHDKAGINPSDTASELPPTINIENAQKVINEPAPVPPKSEPVTVKIERVSIWAKIGAGFAALTGLGINLSNVIETKLNEINLVQLGYVMGGIALIALALWAYDRAQSRAHEKTLAKVDTASDPAKNTVQLER